MQADAANNSVNINRDGYDQGVGGSVSDIDDDRLDLYDGDDDDTDTSHSKSSNNMLIGIIAVAALEAYTKCRCPEGEYG